MAITFTSTQRRGLNRELNNRAIAKWYIVGRIVLSDLFARIAQTIGNDPRLGRESSEASMYAPMLWNGTRLSCLQTKRKTILFFLICVWLREITLEFILHSVKRTNAGLVHEIVIHQIHVSGVRVSRSRSRLYYIR